MDCSWSVDQGGCVFDGRVGDGSCAGRRSELEDGEEFSGVESQREGESVTELVSILIVLRDWWMMMTMVYGVERQNSAASDEAGWKEGHTLFIQALDKPKDPAHAKKLAKLKRNKVLPQDISDELFGFEQFLVGLGKMSLSMWTCHRKFDETNLARCRFGSSWRSLRITFSS